jgi:hypothetical protein
LQAVPGEGGNVLLVVPPAKANVGRASQADLAHLEQVFSRSIPIRLNDGHLRLPHRGIILSHG